MRLSLFSVDFFQTEKTPRDIESHVLLRVTDPDRGLVGIRAHDVEIELDSLGFIVGIHGRNLVRRS